MSRAIAFAVLLLLAQSAGATTVPALTPAQVAARSDVVVEGRVLSRESAWVGRRIFTFVTFEVDATLRGSLAAAEARTRRVTVAIPGGVVGGLGQKVAGAPVLDDGARYALCLSHANGPNGARGVVMYQRGAWRLADDPRDNAALERALAESAP
jgi:hypothetical protein